MPDAGQSSSAGRANSRKFTFLVAAMAMWSMIMYPNRHFGQPILNELMNQALSFLECKRNFNREQSQKKVWTCSCSLGYCAV